MRLALASLTRMRGRPRSSRSRWLCSRRRRSLSSDMDCFGRDDIRKLKKLWNGEGRMKRQGRKWGRVGGRDHGYECDGVVKRIAQGQPGIYPFSGTFTINGSFSRSCTGMTLRPMLSPRDTSAIKLLYNMCFTHVQR